MESHAGRSGERALRGGNTPNQDGDEESEYRDHMETHKPREMKASAYKLAEEPPRLNFQIPRRNKEKRVLFQDLSSESREFADILNIITSSYKDPASKGNFVYSKPRLIHNEALEKEFIEKRKELKQDGRTEKELAETYCFLLSDNNKVLLFCEKGLSVGSCRMNNLGNPSKGVYLCQFSDLLQVNPLEPGSTGEIIIFKVIKGKVKGIHDNMTKCLDPTPKFDSHFSKNANRVTSVQPFKAFEFTQQYFYEYVNFELASRPRHVCPYAVVSFQFKGKEATAVGPKALPLQRCNSLPSGTHLERCGYTVWKGHFVNGGKEVYQASLQSLTQPFLPFKLPDRIEIGKVMRLDQVKEVVPSTLFSWDLYSGSNEVLKSGMHCSLFEVVEKNKPGESLAELFQKLEEKELVLVNTLHDGGFLFLLSSGQLSNSSERKDVWKNSTLQALFLYSNPRHVSTPSSRPCADRMPLMPVMPNMDSFIPALHHALCKVRGNPLANLAAGVEQQAREYLSSHDSKLVRISYDQKLDDEEKLFPAPRQRFLWESSIRTYTYNPGLFTMPVEKASHMVGSVGFVPKPEPERAGTMDNLSDPEKLLQLIQMNKSLKDGKEKVFEEVPSAAHGLKRKLEGGVTETSAKCMKKANGEAGDAEAEEHTGHQSLLDVLSSIGLQDTDLRKDETQEVLKVVQILNRLSKTSQDTDLRKGKAQGVSVSKILENLNRTLAGASATSTDGAEPINSTQDCDTSLQDSMTKLGLPANCDTDLRSRFVDGEEQEDAQGKTDLEDETAGSLSSLEAFSPCSDTNVQRNSNVPGERSIPWVLIPITGLKTERYSHRRDTSLDDPRFLQSPTVSTHTNPEKKDDAAPDQPDSSVEAEPEPECMEDQDVPLPDDQKESDCPEQSVSDGPDAPALNAVDSIVDEQISAFSSEVQELLTEERVLYVPGPSSQAPRNPSESPMVPFSEYVSHFYTPLPVHTYVDLFRDSLSAFIDPQQNIWDGSVLASGLHSDVAGAPLQPPSTVKPAFASNSVTSSSHSAVSPSTSVHTEHQQPLDSSNLPPQTLLPDKQAEEGRVPQDARGFYESHQDEASHRSIGSPTVETQPWLAAGDTVADRGRMANEDASIEPPPANISSLISQLQPEVISNLAKIIRDVQKNTSHFYVHCVDEDSDVCWEIKEYLTRLGNPECDPQTFLDKKYSQDKLLIVIQNIDIAAHIHKIPALVSLKKLPSVSFAGVDSLDDIKNHTYNELFVSGGFIVSDEFVLNPDFISQERLQALLHYLEELNTPESPWRWRVHWKSHKKVIELSRSKSEALKVLNLLTTYHKKQIVEFLSYHECDSPLHQAPDLDCLVTLQAQNTRQRHVIFLTERRFEMFPHYSSSGIVIANIDDILYSMASLIGEALDKPPVSDLPSCPISPTLREADTSQSSEIHTSGMASCSTEDRAFEGTNEEPGLPTDPAPFVSDHAVGDDENMAPLPSPSNELPKDLDFEALRAAISHFRVARMQASASSSGHSSPRPFTLKPNQSFVCKSDPSQSFAQCWSDDDELSNNSARSFQARQGSAAEMQHLAVNTSTSEGPGYGRASDHAQSVSKSECPTTSQGREGFSRTSEVLGALDPSPVKPATSGTILTVPETTSSISTDKQPTRKRTNTTPETPSSPKTDGDPDQDKNAAVALTIQTLTSSSSRSVEHEKPNSRDGLLPVPRSVTYSVNNTLVGMDRMLLQRRGLWAASQGSIGLSSHGLTSQNGVLGHRAVASSLGMVTQSGLRGLIPGSNLRMPWNSLAQGAAPNIWTIQQGVRLGQVHRTPYIQSYTWHGNPAFQGNAYPPHRGSYGSW